MGIVEVKELTKVYPGQIRALDGVSFSIGKGEVFGLLGPNGAGKTTLLHILATLLQPTRGKATVDGYDVVEEPDSVRKKIGIVFQEPSSDDILTGYENLMLHAMMFGMPREEWEQRIGEALELVELSSRANDRVKFYSGGMRRRLELARGLLHRPKLLFLDEPTLGLDPQSRENSWRYIKRLVSEEDVTVIITTHYMEEADHLCDRVAIIDYGKITVLEEPKKLKQEIGERIVLYGAVGEPAGKLPFVNRMVRRDRGVELWVDDIGESLKPALEAFQSFEKVDIKYPSLNDVFLKHTGRELREESPEGGYIQRIMKARKRR